jgi:ABC-type multidrug transport system permease subunit
LNLKPGTATLNLKRLWIMIIARNREFFRDRAAFGWNFLFPFLIVAGFGLIFGGEAHRTFKVGVFPHATNGMVVDALNIPEGFKRTEQVEFIGFEDRRTGLNRLAHHKIDFLLEAGPPPHRYWVNDTAPKGYIIERLFAASLCPPPAAHLAARGTIHGTPIRYLDWLFPGILGMNMMFSALWGVGYAVVRYRKNGVLRRLKATPLTAFEYLSAQMVSRIFLLMFTLVVVWTGCDLLFDFQVQGRYFDLLIVFFVGSLSLAALGLILAARGTSEEFTTGVLNFISWPMMFLSEVWFSLEGAPAWVRASANIFPLKHLLDAARAVMNDGATLVDVSPQLGLLAAMTLLFLIVSAALFSWTK